MELIGKPSIHPLLFYSGKLSGYAIWALFALSLAGLPLVPAHSWAPARYTSFILLAAGLFLTVVSMLNLGRSTRLGLPTGDTALKTGGIYRLSRNPMYLGFDLLTLASVLFHLNIIVAVFGAYSMAVYHLIILAEERFMEQRFGGVYFEYKSRVRRYVSPIFPFPRGKGAGG